MKYPCLYLAITCYNDGFHQRFGLISSPLIDAEPTFLEGELIHTCSECDREFRTYDIPGKCPVCGEWAKIRCESCGYASGAKLFVDRDCKCPKCGTKVQVPGAAGVNLWVFVAIAAIVAALGVVFLLLRN